ncbi:MAG: hypothetical protein IPI46_08035 [Bacteroidetes bacterium]|nr:hypothetical protein [Bacteroidota bacterium]
MSNCINIKSIYYKDSDTIDIVLRTTKHSGFTFITAYKGIKKIDEIETTFCSYSGSMDSTQKPYAGIGLLERIKMDSISKALSKISQNGVSFRITNALFERRLDLSHHEVRSFTDKDELIENQIEPLKLLNGNWEGYFLKMILKVWRV